MELQILQWIQENVRHPILDRVLVWLTYTGELGAIWIIWALLLLLLPAWRNYRRQGLCMLISLALGGIFCNLLLKPIIARPRPFIGHLQDYPHLVGFPSEFSFPSGHATASFSAAAVFCWTKVVWSWLPLLLAVAISFSRLYVFVHYPSDILVGLVLGFVNAYLAQCIVEWMEKRYRGLQNFLSEKNNERFLSK